MNNLVIVAISAFNGEDAREDSNGLMPVYLTPIAGKSPNRNVIAGTVAKNSGLEVGKSYLVKWTRLEDDPTYGPQFSWTKVAEISNPMDIIKAEQELGAGTIFSVDAKEVKEETSTSNTRKEKTTEAQQG